MRLPSCFLLSEKEIAVLILGGRKDDVFRLGDDVRIVVVETRPDGYIRLGFEAPRDVPIHRQKVYEAIKRAKDDGGAT